MKKSIALALGCLLLLAGCAQNNPPPSASAQSVAAPPSVPPALSAPPASGTPAAAAPVLAPIEFEGRERKIAALYGGENTQIFTFILPEGITRAEFSMTSNLGGEKTTLRLIQFELKAGGANPEGLLLVSLGATGQMRVAYTYGGSYGAQWEEGDETGGEEATSLPVGEAAPAEETALPAFGATMGTQAIEAGVPLPLAALAAGEEGEVATPNPTALFVQDEAWEAYGWVKLVTVTFF